MVASALASLSFLAINKTKTEQKVEPSNQPDHHQQQIVVQITDLCVNTSPQSMALASLEDTEGKVLFSCNQIKAFQRYDGSVEYAKELASMKDLYGKTFFTGYDIVAFKSVGGTAEYAKKFVSEKNKEGYSFSGNQLPHLYALGLDIKEVTTFKDNPSKPNGFIEYPAYDGDLFEENYGAFRVESAISFFRSMREKYDLKIVVAYQESMIYDALDANVYEFAMFAGHGSDKDLTLNKNLLQTTGTDKNEIYLIDTSDLELAKHLQQHLTPNAVIFLNSCSTAAGGEKGDNLANTIADWAPGRTIIAPQEVLWTHRVITNPNALYPFDVTLLDKKGQRDITYKTIH